LGATRPKPRSIWAVFALLTQSVIRLRQQVALSRETGGWRNKQKLFLYFVFVCNELCSLFSKTKTKLQKNFATVQTRHENYLLIVCVKKTLLTESKHNTEWCANSK
jgi:hypothetical protein